jgi:interleukin-1 receptor-associated kinase 1
LRFYLKQIPCKVALIQDNLSVVIEKPHTTAETDALEQKLFYSISKPVPVLNSPTNESYKQSVISSGSFSSFFNALESSDMPASLLPSSSYRSHEHKNSLDFGSSAKPEKSG